MLVATECTSAKRASEVGLPCDSVDVKYNYTVSVVPLWAVANAKKRNETFFVSMRSLML